MDFSDQYTGGESNDLAYDLRQRYAKIVGDHLEIVAHHRQTNNFPEYFKALQNLFIIVQHKFKKPKKKDKNPETFDDYIESIIEISNKHTDAWTNAKTNDAEAVGEIEIALKSAEMFLYSKMDEAGMFGTVRDVESLI